MHEHGSELGTGEPTGRLAALDVFRGLTIAAMLVVNNPGTWEHVYLPLRHAAWDGCTPTDLIFPFFLFIVGVSMAFSRRLAMRCESNLRVDRGRTMVMIAKRGVTLVLIGLAINLLSVLLRGDMDVSRWRWPGVLQRIGVCYIVVAGVAMFVRPRWQVVVGVIVLAGYAALVGTVSAPGAAASSTSMEGNFVAWVDRAVLGAGHMYRDGKHDPEGLLSTLPAIVTTMIGLWVGRAMRARTVDWRLVAGLSGAGAVTLAAGWVLGRFGVPINKELWSSSYVLLTGGAAIMGLAACVALVELWSAGRNLFWPAEIMGINAMVAFVGSGVMARLMGAVKIGDPGVGLNRWMFERWFATPQRPEFGSLLFALAILVFWWIALWFLARLRWVWRV